MDPNANHGGATNATNATNAKTHRDLLPKSLCPALLMKQILTHSLDDQVAGEREWPGDGYWWCSRTCTCVGPDDEIVHPKDCVPGRSCYDGPKGSRSDPFGPL